MANDPTPTPQASAATPSPTATVHVRHEVRSPEGEKALAAYASAVALMKGRAESDPTSWSYQAAMHGTYQEPFQQLWNGCKHFSWYFLPWHRMFVHCFEQIVRAEVVQQGGSEDWALPYWNYELGGEHASIPPAFRDPAANGGENPLYVQQRAQGVNQGAPLPGAITTSRFALACAGFVGETEFGGGEAPATPQFSREPGELEQTPHNVIHDKLGGRGGWMSDPDTAAQDPIFWLHHAQIDRLWARWISEGHANPQDGGWQGQSFEFFDVDGKLLSMRCMDVLDTVADLGYEYDQLKP